MKNLKRILGLCLTILLLNSCDDYLDVEPKGLVIPNAVEDYDLLLNGDVRTIHTTGDDNAAVFYTADDWDALGLEMNDPDNARDLRYLIYTWDKELFAGEGAGSALVCVIYKYLYV